MIHKRSPKERNREKTNQIKTETYAQSPTPFYTYFLLNLYLLQLLSLLLPSLVVRERIVGRIENTKPSTDEACTVD